MFRNYFKIAFRNIWRNKVFSIIKIVGLSLGLMVCILILLYTKDEISYDQFHINKMQLFRIIQTWEFGKNPRQVLGITNGMVGESFAKEIPEIQQYVRINGAPVTLKKDNEVFTEDCLFVDDNYFSVFSFPLISGNKQTVLEDLHSVVISKSMAKKYFGSTNPVGKIMEMKLADEFENFKITGVAENAPQNSTLKTGLVANINYYQKFNSNTGWLGGSLNTFLLLSPKANINSVENKMQAVFDKNTKEQMAKAAKETGMSAKITMGLQPFTDIHLSTSAGPDNGMAAGSSPIYSYILSCIGIFILIIACINFINIAVAQSLKRSKEIGIRKVVGGTRMQLIKQFLVESFFVSLIAFVLAIVLTYIVLPFFNELANKKLSLAYLSDVYLYIGFFLLLLVTSFIAGFYPSLVLSAFQPVKVLYGKQKLLGRNYLTRGLIVLQFALAIFLIIGTLAIRSQLNYFYHADLGFDSKGLVRINIPISNASNNLPSLFKNELAGKPNIISVSAKNGGRSISGITADGKNIEIENNRFDEKLLPTFKIPLISGRNFSSEYPSDTVNAIIVNEAFVREAGWKLNDAVGKTVTSMDESKKSLKIVGVIKDYHFISLKEKITPQVISMNPVFNYGEIWVKISSADVPKTLALLQNTYKKIIPYFPYSYQFMDDINAKNYESETKWKQIISISAILFIFISCIGLLGLVMLSVEQKTKEIGIRKVLGAAVSRIVLIIAKDFLLLTSIAFIIAIPLGYWAVHEWLNNFAYRATIHWEIFAIAGILVIGVAMLTIGVHAIKAALANPVKSLRTE